MKWQLQEIINEGKFTKKDMVAIPEHLHEALGDAINEQGYTSLKQLQIKECHLQYKKEEMNTLIKARVENMLSYVDPEKIQEDSS